MIIYIHITLSLLIKLFVSPKNLLNRLLAGLHTFFKMKGNDGTTDVPYKRMVQWNSSRNPETTY